MPDNQKKQVKEVETRDYTIEQKLETSKPPYCLYKYFIKFSDGREGDCCVFIDTVIKCSCQFTEAQMKRFMALGIKKTDICICLDSFHPHGRGLYPDKCSFMRKGVGTEILETIIESLKIHNAKFIFCVASTDSMKAFVQKHKWTYCNRRKTIFYKMLGTDSS